eukprot:2093015-Prymnesium_polylepis.1
MDIFPFAQEDNPNPGGATAVNCETAYAPCVRRGSGAEPRRGSGRSHFAFCAFSELKFSSLSDQAIKTPRTEANVHTARRRLACAGLRRRPLR